MEPIKKRRNSILKKKSDEDTTTEIIKARRISFSGKKSVKEFIAGEEAETIWGTSYEESADDLKVSSSESGLVNVHVKRIQLRNRRVICDPQQQKRRSSSSKKKVLIAENDKENLCVKSNPQPVEPAQEVNSPLSSVKIEKPQSKSELAVWKNEQNVNVLKSQEAMPPKKLIVDCSSICSSTFDFINFSAQINKTITIEQSLDVSLNESELQMFKFRVPVTATEISPNTSNVLCRSILMSEDDVNVLKMVRKQKGGIHVIREKITDDELNLIETKKRDVGKTNMPQTNIEETIIQGVTDGIATEIASSSMEIFQIQDGKGSKRKSERTPHSFVLDSSLVEMNSPMRKKPMHTLYCSSMDVTNNLIGNSSQNDPNERPTIYEPIEVDESVLNNNPIERQTINFDSVAVEESAVGILHSLSGSKTLSRTIFDSKTINESSSFPNTTASCLAMGNQTDGITMELSMCVPKVQENTQANEQTKYSLVGGQQSVHMNIEHFEQTQPLSIVKHSQTIYDSSDVEEITVPTNHVMKKSENQRQSIYTSIYMDEESPKSSKILKTNNTKGLKLRQTILTPEEIIDDTSKISVPKSVLQKTIITPINIFEDSIQAEPETKGIKKSRETIYDPVEIKENIIPCQTEIVYSRKNKGKRESIYTPTDMVEDSPKPNAAKKASIIGQQQQIIINSKDVVKDTPANLTSQTMLQRTIKTSVNDIEELGTTSKKPAKNSQTIFDSTDIELYALPLQISKKNNSRQSVYTPSDMIEDSPKCTVTSGAQSKRIISSGNLKTRHTIFTPEDIIEDAPNEFTAKSLPQNTIERPIDMLEDSVQTKTVSETMANNVSFEIEEPDPNVHGIARCKAPAPRQTIFTPENIIDDSVQEIVFEDALQKTTKVPINIFEDSLKSETFSKPTFNNRQTKSQEASNGPEASSQPIYTANISTTKNKTRESIYTPSDMIEDSPKLTRRAEIVEDFPKNFVSESLLQKTNKSLISSEKTYKNRATTLHSADIEEFTIPIQEAISSSNTKSNHLVKNRKTIHDAVDIEETIKPGTVWNKSNMSMELMDTHSDIGSPKCSQSSKQQSSVRDIQTCQSIFISEDIIENIIKQNESKNLLQKTIKIPINIFEDSLQEEPTLKQVEKDRRTIYDIADIQEDFAPIQSVTSVSQINKTRKSISTPIEIIPDDLEETKPIQDNAREPKKSHVKRQTTYNPVDISLDTNTATQLSADLNVKKDQKMRKTIHTPTDIVGDQPKAVKQHPPSKIQVFRRESSSTDLTAKKSLLLQPGAIQQHVAVNSKVHASSSKPPQFSFAVHQANLKKRQSIHTPVDMVEDSPKPVKAIQPSRPKVIVRKTVYESCDIKTDPLKSPSVEKNHHQTIKSQADIVIDSPATIPEKSLPKNSRQTIHNALEMEDDSPKRDINEKAVEIEEKQFRPHENKPNLQEINVQLEKGSDLPFRKPTKLFSETFKSLQNPYSSTKSLMDKVMQDMGYSMNFQLEFPPEVASQKLSQSKDIDSQKEFDPSMNFSVRQDVGKEAVSLDNSMELSIVNEINSKKHKQQTMCFSEGIEVEMENGNGIQSENSQLYKTSSDESLMELSTSNAAMNAQDKMEDHQNIGQSVSLPKPVSRQQYQFNDEKMNKKSSNQSNSSLVGHSSKRELGILQSKNFEKEATCGKQITDNSMDLSILKSHNSFQQPVSRESAFTRHNSQDTHIASATSSYHNMEILVLPKAPSTRQTIHFNQDLDVEDNYANQKSLHVSTNSKKDQDNLLEQSAHTIPSFQTMLIQQDQQEAIAHAAKSQVLNYPCRKTIHCYEDLEQSLVASVNQKDIEKTELNKENTLSQEFRCKTVHLNEDLELEGIYNRPETSLKCLNRQTINFNESIDDVKKVENQQESCNKQAKKKPCRKTILMNQDLDLSDTDDLKKIPSQIPSKDSSKTYHRTIKDLCVDKNEKVSNQVIPQRPNRQTIHFNQDLDLSEISQNPSTQIPSRDSTKTDRPTYHVNQGLDADERQEIASQVIPQRPNRQTIHYDQDIDLCEMDDSQEVLPLFPSKDTSKPYRQTNNLNQDLIADESQEVNVEAIPHRSNRQTIHFNQDVDLSGSDDLQKVSPQIASRDSIKTNRRTNYLNQDLDVDEHQEIAAQIISQRSNRETNNFNQHFEVNDHQSFASKSSNQRHHIDDSKRKTILMNQELDMSIALGEQSIPPNKAQNVEKNSQESVRRTIYFQQELEIEDQDNTNEKFAKTQQLSRSEFDDEYVKRMKLLNETKKNTEENKSHFLFTDKSELVRKPLNFNNEPEFINTRNCQTIHFTNNNSLDESVQAIGDDNTINPSKTNRNCLKDVSVAKVLSKPRRVTICDAQPVDMDGSLLAKSTARKSSFSRILNFDEVSTVKNETSHQKSTSVAKSKVTWEPTSKDDESPIYNPSFRSKCPMTPSEVDRSLAEYLKVEAALEDQDEEIFYDAEDGTENEKQNKRQTCHMPVDILEESGMQPLQSLILKRQTTFSPKEMTNESFDNGKSKLGVRETNNVLSTLYNDTRQNASDIRMEKQIPDTSHKVPFQKSLESKDMMEVSQSHVSTSNGKQILMEPPLEINFIDQTSKTSVQRNRPTLHFNESINIADVSNVWKPSSAVQSVKELLLENTRLFSQSNLLKPSAFETKRSTVLFSANDDSMDVSCLDSGPTDLESTPTKNKISRIPQLIGSAKKLESLKKSMEFIQQELPNIGCHLINTKPYVEDIDDSRKDQETPRRFSTSIPKKLQELEESFDAIELSEKPVLPATYKTVESPRKVVRQLEESFDTIDIPRKVLSSVRKTVEASPRKNAIHEFEEPYDADEISRRTINVNSRALQESFDTVEIPRRGTTFQRNVTLYICPNEKETTINASQKSLFHFEDPPITVSDVSTFFSKKLLPNTKNAAPTYSPNTTEALCKMNVNDIQALSRSPDSEDTTHNLAHFKKRYVELTCDSIELSNSRDYIEKTHLSLVNTFDDESEMVQPIPQIEITAANEVSPPAKEHLLKPKSSICRKCKCQKLSTTQNDTTIGSFMLEPLPVYKVDLSELEQMAKKPNIADVGKVWRQKLRESDSFNVSDGSRSMAIDDEDSESIEKLLMELAEERLANAEHRQTNRKEVKIQNSFLYKVRRKMQSKSNWIINDLLLFNNLILLTHTRIRTFAILINFTPKDPRGVEVIFNDIQFKPNMLHTRQWKPFEYALHYQLLVELPFDLKKICPTSEHFFDLLEHVEKVTEDVLRTGKEMLSLILPSPASLIKEPSGRLYIRKYVRTKTPQNDVKRTEIHIEVRNIKKLSYESIAMPPLYEFDENIQLLPVGNDFLRKFLNDPLKFIKT